MTKFFVTLFFHHAIARVAPGGLEWTVEKGAKKEKSDFRKAFFLCSKVVFLLRGVPIRRGADVDL